MGDPTASMGTMAALGSRLRALLATTGKTAMDGRAEDQVCDVMTPEDYAFWDACPADLMQDVGVYIATMDTSAEVLVARMEAMVRTESEGSGALRVAVATFHGLKVAKRWDVLQLASLALADTVYGEIQQRLEENDGEILFILVSFYASMLLGFQHSGELFCRAQLQLTALAPMIAAIGHETLTRCFATTVAALVHCQRAYEVEGAALRKVMEDAFGVVVAQRPIAECEAALREAAWILPPMTLNRYLATVEGNWVLDEFSSEQHASAATAPQNAGSITLKKVANVAAYDFQATVNDTRNKTQLQLDGALFRSLDDEAGQPPGWQLEGHWSQLLGSQAGSTVEAVAAAASPVTPDPWTCAKCTLSNAPSATKCATCGADAPKNVSLQTTQGGSKTTNPAPFQAVYDANHTFMRVRWSRGEQFGVWLAKKDESSDRFDLSESLSEATSTAMVDSNVIPGHAYSPRGDPARVLLLEKTYPLSTYGEMAVELWVRVDGGGSTNELKQTILAAGEFELFLQPASNELVWNVGSGQHVVVAAASPVFDGRFHHVALVFGRQLLQLVVDGVLVGQVDRGSPDQNSIPSRRSAWISIGGCVSDDATQVDACFHGVLVDLRIWSDLSMRSQCSPTAALSGSETGLIGYFPLVGDSHRILLDASKHDNHATVFASNGQRNADEQATIFCPSSPVEEIPVTKMFSSSVGNFDLSGVTAYGDLVGGSSGACSGLRIGNPCAVWHKAPVSIEHGFRSCIAVDQLASMSTQSSRVVFAVCEASYWDVAPLIHEAESLGLSMDVDSSRHQYGGSALLVALERTPSGMPSTHSATVTVFVWKDRRALQVCRISNLPLAFDAKSGLVVTYTRSACLLSVEVMGSGAVVDVAMDLEAALHLESTSVRTGVIVTTPVLPTIPTPPAASCSSLLTTWTFEGLREANPDATNALYEMYPRLKQFGHASGHTSGASGAGEGDSNVVTIACTRATSDGSAIEQATYGCQTCGVVHGAGLCRICAVVCHGGHELVYMGSMITACACSMRTAGQCKCAMPVPASEFPSVSQSAPKVAQWYCTRCTVVNAVSARDCTVCGNKAPDLSVLGLLPTVEKAHEVSTSRALVPVEPLATSPSAPPVSIPNDWACPACTYFNTGETAKCVICDTSRPTPAGQEPIKEAKDGLMTLYYAAENQGGKAADPPIANVIAPAAAARPPTPWTCSACTMENEANNNSCFICQTPRAVPMASPVDAIDLGAELPTILPVAVPMETDAVPVAGAVRSESNPLMDNVYQLNQFRLQQAAEHSNAFDGLSPTVEANVSTTTQTQWDSTAGALTISLSRQMFIAQYVEGEYSGKDGYVRGLARLSVENETSSPQWKLNGRFKKLSQSQENALSLTWDRSMTRFDGKWFRGDGSGEWKCLASPLIHDFRGLTPVDPTKPSSALQPFYSGLINMKQNLTNVCYQNSFLQSLFLTQAFRRLILSSNLEDYMHVPEEAGSGSQGDVLMAVQGLFSRLVASQRPELDSHVLQRCLPSTFQAGRQQDTSDFAHFLIDSLSQQLGQHTGTAHGIDDVFGGTQATILACKTCGKKSVNREYFWELLLNMIDLRYTPITSICAVTGVSSEIMTPAGYERINSDLNKDRNGVPYVYLCVKRKPETSVDAASACELPITDLVVKVVGFAETKPVMDGYERVDLDLNIGGSTAVAGGKKQVYLFFRRELHGSPITDLQLIYGDESVPDGFKQIRVDLNQGDATKVFLCYRCDMPITDMKIVNTGIPGYRMVDHVLNRSNEDNVKQYLAFKVGGSEPCITDFRLIPATEATVYNEQGWETLGCPSSTYRDEDGPREVLAIRRGHGNPIFAIDVFRAPREVPRYQDYEVIDLYGKQAMAAAASASAGVAEAAASLKGDWLAGETVDRGRKAVRIHSVSDPIPDALVIKGSFEDKGEVTAVATASTSSWSAVSSGEHSSRVLRVSGYWKSTKTKQAQLFDVELRPGVGEDSMYTLNGTVGDGRGRSVAVAGTQTSRNVRVKWPISQVLVLRGDERVPEGVEVVRETCSGKTGNLLVQTQSPHTLYLAVKREETPADGFVSDVCVIYGEIDAVPEGYTCVQATPAGHSANLNDGTTGVPIFLCYRRVTSATEKCLMDLALMWTSGAQVDPLPAGFTKIQHTPLGMEANINQGTNGVAIHLCFAKCDPNDVVRPVEDPLNGEYELTTAAATAGANAAVPLIGKFIRLSVAERTDTAYTLEGKFGTVFHGRLPGMVRGTLYTSTQRKKRFITGVWMSDEQNASSMIDFVPPSFPFEWTLNDTCNELDGWWSGADDASAQVPTAPKAAGSGSGSGATSSAANKLTVNSWKVMKDAYVRVAFKKDYGTEWKNGQLVSSERVWRHNVESMLSRFVASRTLGGDNLLSCSQCDRKTESRTNTVVVAPPAHLIVTLKRMFYDWAQQKTRKCLHDVTFPVLLTLPSLSSEDEDAIYADKEMKKKDHSSRQYGLYGVLVHSGLTANSGHYFSFCRESDDSTKQLHLEDSPLAPWIKFNDSKVEQSSWAEINYAVSSSVSDTVYLLLYKRLSYTPENVNQGSMAVDDEDTVMDADHGDDDDEAMLLAKAMALSMSAASLKKAAEERDQHSASGEETKTDDEGDDAAAEATASDAIVARLMDSRVLKEVEAANSQFILDTMRTAASGVHVKDLHAFLAVRYGLQ